MPASSIVGRCAAGRICAGRQAGMNSFAIRASPTSPLKNNVGPTTLHGAGRYCQESVTATAGSGRTTLMNRP
jgi:hypothetical protein